MDRSVWKENLGTLVCLLFWITTTSGFNINTNNPEIYSSSSGTNFGYTVAQYIINGTKWILVGAPHDSQDGKVYRCGDGDCATFPFNLNLASGSSMTEGFFGASLMAERDGLVVACAPRSRFHIPGDRFEEEKIHMMGACFVYDGAKDQFLSPFTPCKPGTHGVLPGRFGCGAGFSVAPGQHDFSFFIGGLGANSFSGEFIRMQTVSPTRPDYGSGADYQNYDYQSYAVATGRFSGRDELDIVTGAPRANLHLGKVQIYQRILQSEGGWRTLGQSLNGTQVGSYFGSVLAVGDLDGDGLDDLIVGAPFFANEKTKRYNTGRIYLYYQLDITDRSPNEIFLATPTVIEGASDVSGLFGASLAVLKDINNDGFQDLAVGAPLGGQGGQGAVSVFLGADSGLSTPRAQLLEGHQISPGVQGFGSSIAGSEDMDGNGYTDVLIGAAKSAKVFSFRTHPVIRVTAGINIEPSVIQPENIDCAVTLPPDATTCISATTDVVYEGIAVPQNMDFALTWSFDIHNATERIAFFETEPGKKSHSVSTQERLIKGEQMTFTHSIFLTREVVTYMKPIGVLVSYDLVNQPIRIADPVLDQSTPPRDMAQFEIFRPPADITISVSSTSPNVVLAMGEIIELVVDVENTSPVPCYRVDLLVLSHPGITYSNIDSPNSFTCYLSGSSGTLTLCNLGFLIAGDSKISFTLHMSVETPKLLLNTTMLHFGFNLTSANDINPENDIADIQLQLTTSSRLEVTGKSDPDQITMTGQEANVTHVIKVSNVGRTPLRSADLWIRWPVATAEGVPLLGYPSGPAFRGGRGHCHGHEHSLAPLETTTLEPCSNAEIIPEMCAVLHCTVDYVEEQEIISVNISGTVLPNITALSEIDNTIALRSLVKVEGHPLVDNSVGGSVVMDETEVLTQIVFPGVRRPPEKVATWIIILSLVIGLTLLVVLIVILWKLGFFRRKAREELYSAKRVSVNENWTSRSRMGSADDEDNQADDEDSNPSDSIASDKNCYSNDNYADNRYQTK